MNALYERLRMHASQRNVQPRFHGNGFTQLYLDPETRLHVWHPNLQPIRDHNASIHTHRYDVFSTIYAGKLWHRTYNILTDAPEEEHDVRVIQLDGASDAHKTPEIETGLTGKLEVRHEYWFTKGSSYTFRKDLFHSSDATPEDGEPIVTIFERQNKNPDGQWAKVLCGIKDEVATHAFDPEQQPEQDALWEAMQSGLTFLEGSTKYDFHQKLTDLGIPVLE